MTDNPVPLTDLMKALDDLIMQDAPPPLADDDITVATLAKRAKCGHKKAENMIAKWELDGKVEYAGKRRGPRGHAVDAWRIVKVEKKEKV